jgi:hypothetical protein
MQELRKLDELEKVIAENDLKTYELSRIKETLQALFEDIEEMENRLRLVKRALGAQSMPKPRLNKEAAVVV